MAGPVPPAVESNILLRDVEFPEHVLKKWVVYVVFDPIQPDDTSFELIRQFSIHDRRPRCRIHVRNDRVRSAAGLGIIIRAYGAVPVRKVFGKESKTEEREITEVLVIVTAHGR